MPAIETNSIDAYIASYPTAVQNMLQQVRKTIQKAAPGAEERISYNMPAFTWKGKYLVYFGAYKKHIGLYPVPSKNKIFEKDFAGYATSGKGTIQFPLDKPLPLDLVTRIVEFRMKETMEKEKKKAIEKKKK